MREVSWMLLLMNAAEGIVYDALYAYCQEMVRQGKPNGAVTK
jgi:hypothetical protein